MNTTKSLIIAALFATVGAASFAQAPAAAKTAPATPVAVATPVAAKPIAATAPAPAASKVVRHKKPHTKKAASAASTGK
jgi:hypothetical protein